MVDPTELRVEELAARASIGVDTVRYYQAQGLLAPPQRQGRTVVYDERHLERLIEIRRLAERGFTLAQIGSLDGSQSDPLLRALVRRGEVEPDLDVNELATRCGLDRALVERIAALGVIGGRPVGDEIRFPASAVEVLSALARVIEAGVPVERLGQLAMRHARHVDALVDDIIELYRDHRRGADRVGVVIEVEELVPLVASMVGSHFEATLVERAARRLRPAPSAGSAGP